MKPTFNVILFFAVLFWLASFSPSQAQFHYNFENISTDHGLSNGWVMSITQDSKGFLWFGTGSGLDRFDGYKFKNFPLHSARVLHEDKSGDIYLVADMGLEVFDPRTERFVSYTQQIDSLRISRRMCSLTEDQEGNYWIATQEYHENKGGLVFFDRKSKQFRRFDDGDMNFTNHSVIDEYGNIWVGGHGISILNPGKGSFVKHFYADNKKPNSLPGNEVRYFYKERDGIIWACTSSGITKISYNRNYEMNFENLKSDQNNKNSLISNNTFCILKDLKNNFWVTTSDGVSLYRPDKHRFTNFISSPASSGGLKESFAGAIYQDRIGTVWIGHMNLGLSKLKSNKGFIQLTNEPGRTGSLAANNTAGVHSDKDGIVWLSVVDQGLHKIDFHGDYNQYPAITISPSRFKRISTIVSDKHNNIWVAGQENGSLYRLKDKLTGPPISFGQGFNYAASALEDCKKNVWFLDESGLFKIERPGVQPTLVKFLPDPRLESKHLNLHFSDLLEDRRKRLWVTNWEGEIYCYDSLAGRFFRPAIKNSLPFNHAGAAISTLTDSQGDYLWVGTLQGLCKYKIENDPANGLTLTLEKVFAEKEGLAKNGKSNLYTATLEEDVNGNIWLAQNSGLYKLDPRTNTLKLYGMEDGLVGNTFAIRASCKLQNGFLAFATTNGLAIFHPDSLKDNSSLPGIVFTDFQLSNQSVPVGRMKEDSTKNAFHLDQTVTYTREIVIPYDQNVLGFEFAALDFTAPEKNQYAYQMVPFDKDWVYSGNRKLATYTNLDPGHYTFKVKGSNNDGYWNEAGTSISLIVLPPPWKTWWAFTGYGLGILFLLVAARKEIVKRERLRNQFKLKELEATKYQELDTLKSRFFGNISHEFRTPLTLILGPLQKRLEQSTSEADKVELSIMRRNASRLLNLVNQLLDLSRLEAGMLKLKCTLGDLRQFVVAIASQFSSIASSRQIRFQVRQEEDIHLYFDSDKLNKIITNLLSNAFKFTPEGGAIEVIIRKGNPESRFNEGFGEIVVTDNGPGINPEQINKIFDRFYQADNSATREYEGSGIGLALTKELVELHGGEITVTSVVGEGSVFMVMLPLGKSHLGTDSIADSPATSEVEHVVENLNGVSNDRTLDVGEAIDETLSRILIVEDNEDLRYYLRENMKQKFQVLEARDGEEGIAAAVLEVPDLVISDLMMPKVNGLELCQRLKGDIRTSHIPIILLTAKADAESRMEGFQTGADDYIPKPFDFRELETRIQNLIEVRKNLQARFSSQLILKPREFKVESMDDRFLKKAVEIIEMNLGDASFSVDRLAIGVAMSPVQLYRKLRALTGNGPNDFIRNFRLDRAASLLSQRAGNVADIADQVGFNSLSYFSKCFKDKFGMPPSQYLRPDE